MGCCGHAGLFAGRADAHPILTCLRFMPAQAAETDGSELTASCDCEVRDVRRGTAVEFDLNARSAAPRASTVAAFARVCATEKHSPRVSESTQSEPCVALRHGFWSNRRAHIATSSRLMLAQTAEAGGRELTTSCECEVRVVCSQPASEFARGAIIAEPHVSSVAASRVGLHDGDAPPHAQAN